MFICSDLSPRKERQAIIVLPYVDQHSYQQPLLTLHSSLGTYLAHPNNSSSYAHSVLQKIIKVKYSLSLSLAVCVYERERERAREREREREHARSTRN